MKRRFLLSAVALFALSVVAATNSARANLFGCPGCCEAPKACEACKACAPACGCTEACAPKSCRPCLFERLKAKLACCHPCCEKSCCAPACCEAPKACAPCAPACEAPKCCEPACGCVPKSCRPCLLERLKAKWACCHPCCEKGCCAPACCEAPKACAPCAPAACARHPALRRPAPGLRLRVRPQVPSLPLGRTEGQVSLLPSLLREGLLCPGLLRSPQGLCSGGLRPAPCAPAACGCEVRSQVPSLPLGRTEGQAGLLPHLLREGLLRPGLLRSPQGLCSGGLRSGSLCPGLLRSGLWLQMTP